MSVVSASIPAAAPVAANQNPLPENNHLMIDLSKAVLNKGEVYVPEAGPLFVSYRKIQIKPGDISCMYRGPKIPLPLWRQITSFMRWTQAEFKSESQLRLFLNIKTGEWAADVLPQPARNGMTTQEIPNHPDRAAIMRKYLEKDGWFPAGTVHHHCNASAWQSGTDAHDERNQNGIHITVGHMESINEYSIHGRASYGGTFFDIYWSSWFTLGAPDDFLDGLPHKIKEDIFKYFLQQTTVVDFPEEWKARMIDLPPTPSFQAGAAAGAPQTQHAATPWRPADSQIGNSRQLPSSSVPGSVKALVGPATPTHSPSPKTATTSTGGRKAEHSARDHWDEYYKTAAGMTEVSQAVAELAKEAIDDSPSGRMERAEAAEIAMRAFLANKGVKLAAIREDFVSNRGMTNHMLDEHQSHMRALEEIAETLGLRLDMLFDLVTCK